MRIEFDTRDKKPKLFDLLIVAVVVGVIVGLITLGGIGDNGPIIAVLFGAFLLFAAARFFVAFVQQLKYNPYSYNAAYFFGFGLFGLCRFWFFRQRFRFVRDRLRHLRHSAFSVRPARPTPHL